jgi:hypothetical protein
MERKISRTPLVRSAKPHARSLSRLNLAGGRDAATEKAEASHLGHHLFGGTFQFPLRIW